MPDSCASYKGTLGASAPLCVVGSVRSGPARR
jgi:hypothetical protein